MREERGLNQGAIADCLAAHYGLRVVSIAFLPIGNDFQAAVYRVAASDGRDYFLKIRFGPVFEPGLLVPRSLLDRGITNVLAPLRTVTSDLWCPLTGYDDTTVVLYPFVRGENAKIAGLSDDQWRVFGATLRAVHASGLQDRFRGLLRSENFTLPAGAAVRRLLAECAGATFASPAATGFAQFLSDNATRIAALLARAETLGSQLRAKSFDHVLCHGDIHGANILVGDDGRIWLVDWDSPLIAPRERDLLFVIGSRIGRHVTLREEDWFFAGYGPTEIDADALAYYRYERRIEDLGESGERVFRDPHLSEPAREEQAAATMSLFAPGGDIDVAETVPRRRWPRASAAHGRLT
jgi:spectinomycin phosphotransferase